MGEVARLDTCCRKFPELTDGAIVINTCPGCDRRYKENHPKATNKSVWEVITEGDWFPFPDNYESKMSIHDACPTRDQIRLHKAVSTLLKK